MMPFSGKATLPVLAGNQKGYGNDQGRTLCRIDKITQLEILARVFLGGLVERHGEGTRRTRTMSSTAS